MDAAELAPGGGPDDPTAPSALEQMASQEVRSISPRAPFGFLCFLFLAWLVSMAGSFGLLCPAWFSRRCGAWRS
jgi:hypothetical protein